MNRSITRAMGGTAVAVVLAMSIGGSVQAHDPIFVTEDQTTPDTGPFMPDGTISWALYGTVLDRGDTRGFEFDLRQGDEVFVSLLIPNLAPENELSDDLLPVIELEAPDGTMTTIAPEVRDVFDEPFSKTSYVTLAEYREPGQAGRYRGVVIGGAPARFSVAIGETEEFFTPTERSGERPGSFADISAPLTAWYTTLPDGEPDPNQLGAGEAEIDLELIEDAMDSGEAQAPEGRMGNEDEVAEATESAEAAAGAATADPANADVAEQAAAAAPEAAEPATVAADTSGDSSSSTWVAPVAILTIALVGAGAFLFRRRSATV